MTVRILTYDSRTKIEQIADSREILDPPILTADGAFESGFSSSSVSLSGTLYGL